MKKLLFKFAGIASAICFSVNVSAQTAGTLTFKFTPVTMSPGYSGTKNVLAVWIETNTGTFIKTRMRYWGSGTNDHLPTWNTSSKANTTDATTGATLSSFTAKSITWDGKTGPAATATIVADGSYRVAVQETWNHGTSGTVTNYYTFTKGNTTVNLVPANSANFTGLSLVWTPAAVVTGVNESNSENSEIVVYPNPTNGIFNVDFKEANNIKVVNTLGTVVYDEKIDQFTAGTKSIDLSNFANGIYMINVSNGERSSNRKVFLNK